MKILESLKETEKTLKSDVDKGHFPEWHRLKTILNFVNNYPNAKIYETTITGSHHLKSSIPSSMKIRRTIPDCRGRIYVSDRRFEMIGAFGDIIFWTGKAKFQYKIIKGKLKIKWLRKRVSDREISLKDVLALPFWSQIDVHHRKSREKWLKRKKGKLKEERKRLRKES